MAHKQIYVSLLRGINVGGHKKIKMDQLRDSFEALGFERVKTYIQSGNIVFAAANLSPAVLAKKIEEQILSDFGFPVPLVLRTAEELKATVENNPFLKERDVDLEKLHVMFLSDVLASSAIKKLAELTTAPDQARCLDRHIYFSFPNGVSQSVLFKSPIDRILAVVNTTRNWKTVNSIHQMCRECR